MNDLQDKLDHLERLFANANTNKSEIIRCYKKLTEDPSSTQLDDIIPVLNQKAVKLLTTELVDILKIYRLDAYSYLLVANNLLDLEDVKDDLLNGKVLANAIPDNTLRRLKNQLGVTEPATAIQGLTNLVEPMRLTRPVQDGHAHQRHGDSSATASTSTLVGHQQTTTIETMVMNWLTSQRENNAQTRHHGESWVMASALPTVPVAQHQRPTDTKYMSQQFAVARGQHNIRQGETRENSSRLVIKIKDECTYLRRLEGNFFSYQLKLKETTLTGTKTIIKRFPFGEPNQLMDKPWKTILLMGETGSGKTTMINAMVNYVLGVQWEDDFRFMLIKEEVRGGTQAHSQTQGVTAYDLHYQDGFRIPFSLTIVDTPGFGDTRGIERDEEITATIKEFFEHENGIQVLDAIGFVVKSSDARLTHSQKYIFESVLSIFGNDMKDNIHFLVTFFDGSETEPHVLDAIKEAHLPCQTDSNGSPCHFKFNNGAIDIKPSEGDYMSSRKWKLSMKSFESFFLELNNMPTISLQMTKEVLEMRKCLEMQLEFMWGAIDEQMTKIDELRNTEIIIAQNKGKIDDNQNFEITVKVSKKVKEKIDGLQSALNCKKCEVTCHYPCNPILWTKFCPAFWEMSLSTIQAETFSAVSSIMYNSVAKSSTNITSINNPLVTAQKNILGRLLSSQQTLVSVPYETVMNLFTPNPTCKVCPGKCLTENHVNESERWVYREVEEKQTLFDVRRRYEDAMKHQENAEGTLASLNAAIDRFKQNIFTAMKEITNCSNLLKSKALRGDPLTTAEYIQLKIDNEQKEKKYGYAERINILKDVLKIAMENLAGRDWKREEIEQLN